MRLSLILLSLVFTVRLNAKPLSYQKAFASKLSYLNRYVKKDSIYLPPKTYRINGNVVRTGLKGKINDEVRLQIFDALEVATGQTINRKVPLFIAFYPGKDKCNSGGDRYITSPKKNIYQKLLNKKEGVEVIYLYKDKEGLFEFNDYVRYYKDPNGLIESLFFREHYPCSSYVIINTNNEFITQWGEHSLKRVMKDFKWLRYNKVPKEEKRKLKGK